MNHQKIYESIIQKAKSENRIKLRKNNLSYVYYEKHHILPKCLDGTNEKENLVLLTAKEHFVCHKLLTYIYKENRKIICAFYIMTHGNSNKCIKTSRDYAYAKELISSIGLSKETRKKISKSLIGHLVSKETRKKISKSNKGKKPTEEIKRKISESLKGNTYRKGIHCSDEAIKNIINGTRIAMQRPEVQEKIRKPKSEECKKNISKSTNGKSKKELMIKKYGEEEGLQRYEQFIRKTSEANKGKTLSVESIQKIKEKRKLQSPPTLGMKQSKEWIEKRVIKIRKLQKN